MTEQIVKINFLDFQDKYNKISCIPQDILLKVSQLKEKYTCFSSFYDPKMILAKKVYTKKEKDGDNNNKKRFHIIIPNFTNNSIVKRNLIGHLNKLTLKNKDIIYEKIKNIVIENNNEEFFTLIWGYIKINDDIIYIDILSFFEKDFYEEMIEKLWKDYNDNEHWKPPQYIYDNNLLLLNDEYELYCNYIKWKKSTHNINKAWTIVKKNEIPELINRIYDYMYKIINERTVHKYIIDIFMEQIYKFLKIEKSIDVINKIKSLDTTNYNSTTKFIIYYIVDL
jgi:hypothetical protein